jgi:hypothetical protein
MHHTVVEEEPKIHQLDNDNHPEWINFAWRYWDFSGQRLSSFIHSGQENYRTIQGQRPPSFITLTKCLISAQVGESKTEV